MCAAEVTVLAFFARRGARAGVVADDASTAGADDARLREGGGGKNSSARRTAVSTRVLLMMGMRVLVKASPSSSIVGRPCAVFMAARNLRRISWRTKNATLSVLYEPSTCLRIASRSPLSL